MSRHEDNEKFAVAMQKGMAARELYTGAIDGWAGTRTTAAAEALFALVPVRPILMEPPPVEAPRAPAAGVFNDPSVALLDGIHPRLVAVMKAARAAVVFDIIEGLRTLDRQRQLVARGLSKTMASRHLTGHAVDVWPIDPATGKRVTHPDAAERDRLLWHHLRIVAAAVKAAAKAQGTMIEWGGDWGWDAPHFQLNRQQFP